MPILRAAATSFALVFGTGFVLGAIRVPFLVPLLGQRTAELLEMPWMALVLMLLAELAAGMLILERPLGEILNDRDPVSGVVYLALLVLYALLPLLLLGRGSTTTAVP